MADDDPFAKYGTAAAAARAEADPFAKYSAPGFRSAHAAAAARAPPDRSTEAFGKSLLNSATLNFRDELHGLGAAGGLDPDDPDVAHAIAALVRGAYRKMSGDP